jgi:hypothetical protein
MYVIDIVCTDIIYLKGTIKLKFFAWDLRCWIGFVVCSGALNDDNAWVCKSNNLLDNQIGY